MIDIRTKRDLSNIPVLDNSQVYIYVIQNSTGKVKIGKTKNIKQRIRSLGGSNGQGNEIINVYCSEPTYLDSLETIMHSKFNVYRIPNTEWFQSEDNKLLYSSAIETLEDLMKSKSYYKYNDLRKRRCENYESK